MVIFVHVSNEMVIVISEVLQYKTESLRYMKCGVDEK